MKRYLLVILAILSTSTFAYEVPKRIQEQHDKVLKQTEENRRSHAYIPEQPVIEHNKTPIFEYYEGEPSKKIAQSGIFFTYITSKPVAVNGAFTQYLFELANTLKNESDDALLRKNNIREKRYSQVDEVIEDIAFKAPEPVDFQLNFYDNQSFDRLEIKNIYFTYNTKDENKEIKYLSARFVVRVGRNEYQSEHKFEVIYENNLLVDLQFMGRLNNYLLVKEKGESYLQLDKRDFDKVRGSDIVDLKEREKRSAKQQ